MDANEQYFPCLDGMISTLGGDPSQQDYNIVYDSMPELIKLYLNQGQAEESTLDDLTYPPPQFTT